MRRLGALVLSAALVAATAYAANPATASGTFGHLRGGPHGPALRESVVDADQNFRGLDAVSRRTAWVSGESLTDGPARVFRTTDGGRSWRDVTPPDTTGLSFRDVHAVSRAEAFVLSIGPGSASRILHTTDGGATWDAVFVNDDDAAFYDCMAFYPGGRRGLALSDPVDGKFRILATHNFGRTWRVLPNGGMPEAATEYGFAASGDCLVTTGSTAYFGSGGGAARVFRSDDFGRHWTATDSTIPAGESAGVFSLAFRSPRHGLAVGGDFAEPADGVDAVARTDGGRTWTNVGDTTHLVEDAAFLPGVRRPGHARAPWQQLVLATGEYGGAAGTSLSTDDGRTWTPISTTGFHTLDCTRDGSCWAAGSVGRVARLTR